MPGRRSPDAAAAATATLARTNAADLPTSEIEAGPTLAIGEGVYRAPGGVRHGVTPMT